MEETKEAMTRAVSVQNKESTFDFRDAEEKEDLKMLRERAGVNKNIKTESEKAIENKSSLKEQLSDFLYSITHPVLDVPGAVILGASGAIFGAVGGTVAGAAIASAAIPGMAIGLGLGLVVGAALGAFDFGR